jgi:hypothetical protein
MAFSMQVPHIRCHIVRLLTLHLIVCILLILIVRLLIRTFFVYLYFILCSTTRKVKGLLKNDRFDVIETSLNMIIPFILCSSYDYPQILV